jgi:hypothetical protein
MRRSTDPVEAGFAGLISGPIRTVLGLLAILAILFSCHGLKAAHDEQSIEPYEFLFSLVFIDFEWCPWGYWFFVGLVAGIAMWGGLYAFTVVDSPKTAFFVMVTGAVVYFIHLVSEGGWNILAGGYLVLIIMYWGIPRLLWKR